MDKFIASTSFLSCNLISLRKIYGDLRISKLATELLSEMVSKATVCIRKLGGSREREVAFGRLLKNKRRTIEGLPSSISMNFIDIKEKSKAKDKFHWRILTTHEVELLGDALKIIEWYKQSWHIEQLFRTMKKQGFKVEQSQLKNYESLSKSHL